MPTKIPSTAHVPYDCIPMRFITQGSSTATDTALTTEFNSAEAATRFK